MSFSHKARPPDCLRLLGVRGFHKTIGFYWNSHALSLFFLASLLLKSNV